MRSQRPVFNPFDPAYQADPYPILREIREHAPVLETEFGFRLLTKYEDVSRVLSSSQFCLAKDAATRRFPTGSSIGAVCSNAFLFQNDPRHKRLRALSNRAFAPSRIESLRERIGNTVDRLLEALPDCGEIDVVSSLANPLPLELICDLVGIETEDRERVGRMSEALCPTLEPIVAAETIPGLDAAVTEFGELVTEQLRARESDPRDDLLSELAIARKSGDLTEAEAVATCVLILAAGHATTENSISSAILHLLKSPEELARVRADPSLISVAFEESLRLESPIAVFLRWAAEDVVVGGTTIGAGEPVAVHLGAANRDPMLFDRPDSYAVKIRDAKHLAFGSGSHACLGFALARLEAVEVLTRFLQRFRSIELIEDPTWKPTVTVRGVRGLHVRCQV